MIAQRSINTLSLLLKTDECKIASTTSLNNLSKFSIRPIEYILKIDHFIFSSNAPNFDEKSKKNGHYCKTMEWRRFFAIYFIM